MVNQTPNPLLTDFVNKYSNWIQKAEIISVSVLLIGLVLYLLTVEYYEIVLAIGAILTSLVYFLSAFKQINCEDLEVTGVLNTPAFISFNYKLFFWGLSIASASLLGLVIKSFSTILFVKISGMTLTITLLLSILTKLNIRTYLYNSTYYLRTFIAIAILVYLANIEYHWF